MHLKRLLFWGALFCLLLAYVLLFDRPRLQRLPEPPPPIELFERVFQFQDRDIQCIDVLSDGFRVRIAGGPGSWRIQEPAGLLPGGEGLDSFVAAIVDAVVIEVVEEHPSDLGQYGLSLPGIVLNVQLSGVESPQVLELGHTAPAGISMYARRPDQDRVLLVVTYLRFSIRTLLDRVKAAKSPH